MSYHCLYCGMPATPEHDERDHIQFIEVAGPYKLGQGWPENSICTINNHKCFPYTKADLSVEKRHWSGEPKGHLMVRCPYHRGGNDMLNEPLALS